ncbi:MAG: cation diffusion facilitator family transporter [Andreesenia angusta]|nr:cation diffusion facilitator family transporter [Andreesenia angusta]
MINILIRKYIKNYEDVEDKYVREKYGILSGVLGVILNLLLFIIKLIIGYLINSIAVISDAFNNLTDLGSFIITIIGARMSNSPPDQDHPMGHGRIEYVSSLIISMIVILVGFQLFTSSIKKIINPEELVFSYISMIILSLSVFIKIWIYSYNKYIGEKINSSMMKATAMDSISDVYATLAIVIALIIGHFFNLNIDGLVGSIVSILILYTGYSIAKETISLLLGLSPDEELIKKINEIVLSGENIIGTHELKVHDYGPGRRIASIHAEVPDYIDISEAYLSIDEIEEDIKEKLDIDIVIHVEPMFTDAEKVMKVKKDFINILKNVNPEYKIRSLRVTSIRKRTNIIFDLVVPRELENKKESEIIGELKEKVKEKNPDYNLIVNTLIYKSERIVLI